MWDPLWGCTSIKLRRLYESRIAVYRQDLCLSNGVVHMLDLYVDALLVLVLVADVLSTILIYVLVEYVD